MIDHGKERHLDVGVVLRSEQDFLLTNQDFDLGQHFMVRECKRSYSG